MAISKPQREDKQPIIVKRQKRALRLHSAGTWKIAYADFVTSMMAFFLVMWLINVTDQKTKNALANYFNPINLAKSTQESIKGLSDKHPGKTQDYRADAGEKHTYVTSTNSHEYSQAMRELEILHDPYVVIKDVEKEADEALRTSSREGEGGTYGFLSGKDSQSIKDDEHDSFISQIFSQGKRSSDQPSAEEVIRASMNGESPKLSLREEQKKSTPRKEEFAGPEMPKEMKQAVSKALSNAPQNQEESQNAGQAAVSAPDKDFAEQLQQLVNDNNENGDNTPSIHLSKEKNGTLITLSDSDKFGMFDVGSARPRKNTIDILKKLATLLNSKNSKIIINGHTDARPYRSLTYDNWQLSQSRAQMAYYMLLSGGLRKDLLDHIGSYADTKLKDPNHPYDAVNRRIEIFVETPQAPDLRQDKVKKVNKTKNIQPIETKKKRSAPVVSMG